MTEQGPSSGDASASPASESPRSSLDSGSGRRARRRGWGGVFYREIGLPLLLAVIVIQFVIQAFKIPSGSMERSLLVGDFLLGLKFVYGAPIPFTDKRLPALADPKSGDVLIFHYPMDPEVPGNDRERFRTIFKMILFGNLYWDREASPGDKRIVHYQPRDFIKRVVATSGQTVEFRQQELKVDGKVQPLPPNGLYATDSVVLPAFHRAARDSIAPFRVPSPGEVFDLDTLRLDDFVRIYSLALQENPGKAVRCSLWVEQAGTPRPDYLIDLQNARRVEGLEVDQMLLESMEQRPVESMQLVPFLSVPRLSRNLSRLYMPVFIDVPGSRFRQVDHRPPFMHALSGLDRFFQAQGIETRPGLSSRPAVADTAGRAGDSAGADPASGARLVLRKRISVGGPLEQRYTVRDRVLFMMGDNRNNSSDGRFWGYLSSRNVKARAFIIYFSLDDKDGRISLNPLTWGPLPAHIRWSRIGRLVHD